MSTSRTVGSALSLLSLIIVPVFSQSFPSPETAALAELLTPAIRLERHLMSLDYFGQFTRGDTIFEDYLYQIFRLDQGEYAPGEGRRLEVRFGNEDLITIEQALLSNTDDSQRTWRIAITGGGYAIEYEVDVQEPGIPLRIRYRDPEGERFYERTTRIGDEYLRVVDELGSDTIAARVNEEMVEDLIDSLRSGYAGAHRTGTASVRGPDGNVDAELVRNQFEGGGEILYAVSASVPGGLVSISAPGPEGDRILAQLVEVTRGNRSAIDEVHEERARFNDPPQELSSQGEIEEPFSLELGEYIEGSVAEADVSYYTFLAPFDSDYVVEVNGAVGLCELFDYGTDETYWFWRSSSSGAAMTLEYYGITAGTELYFTVEDIVDDYSAGESYYIGVREE